MEFRIEAKTSRKLVQACAMDDTCSILRRWEDMNHDVLVKIFQTLDIFDLISGVGQVCSTWRLAACDPLLWRTLDLSLLESNFIKTTSEPYVYVREESDKTLTRVLKISLNLSKENIATIIFPYNLYISDDHLTYAAARCPHLKRLVMPAWNRIKEAGICHAIHEWKDLESLTMFSISNPHPRVLMKEISEYCKNFSELKIMELFKDDLASILVEFLPKLKVLSLRCSMVYKDALVIILDGLKGLEVLNISHCLLVDPPRAARNVPQKLDTTILERTSKLKKFISCMNDSCVMCQRVRDDEGLMRWYKYEKDLWKVDEVRSLAI